MTADDGHVYSRKSITEWIETCQLAGIPIISPATRQEMGCKLVDDVQMQLLLNNLNATMRKYQWESPSSQYKYESRSKNVGVAINVDFTLEAPRVDEDESKPVDQPEGCNHLEKLKPPLPLSLKNMAQVFEVLDIAPSFTAEVLPAWSPPCITVVGNESSGKSTILERLLMMSIFPRGEDICTRYEVKT